MTDTDETGGWLRPGRVAEPPEALVRHWTKVARIVPESAHWAPLQGGRTNSSWKVEAASGALVVKLFRHGSDTPLFANDPQAEAAVLAALAGTGLAPRLVADGVTPVGPSVVYAHVEGHAWHPDEGIVAVAAALARLHRLPAPPQIGQPAFGTETLLAQGRRMLDDIGSARQALAALEPDTPDSLPAAEPVFLHGDATASNILVTPEGITFIDWQCPARGDPTLDIAVFLSPAMQVVSGNRTLTQREEASFLAAYGNETITARYRALAPLYHWRMAAYCFWRAARGDKGYREAAEAELSRLRG